MKPQKPVVITATDMQKKSGHILRQATKKGTHFVVERDGYPVAVIMPLKDYEAMQNQSTTRVKNNLPH